MSLSLETRSNFLVLHQTHVENHSRAPASSCAGHVTKLSRHADSMAVVQAQNIAHATFLSSRARIVSVMSNAPYRLLRVNLLMTRWRCRRVMSRVSLVSQIPCVSFRTTMGYHRLSECVCVRCLTLFSPSVLLFSGEPASLNWLSLPMRVFLCLHDAT